MITNYDYYIRPLFKDDNMPPTNMCDIIRNYKLITQKLTCTEVGCPECQMLFLKWLDEKYDPVYYDDNNAVLLPGDIIKVTMKNSENFFYRIFIRKDENKSYITYKDGYDIDNSDDMINIETWDCGFCVTKGESND